jgi:hypothetical protein
MNAKTYWAILDRDGQAVGEWMGLSYFVFCYEKYSQAKCDAIALGLRDYKICVAEYALKRSDL